MWLSLYWFLSGVVFLITVGAIVWELARWG